MPVQGATVKLTMPNGTSTTYETDENGRLQLIETRKEFPILYLVAAAIVGIVVLAFIVIKLKKKK